jgi:hypothetical protein
MRLFFFDRFVLNDFFLRVVLVFLFILNGLLLSGVAHFEFFR